MEILRELGSQKSKGSKSSYSLNELQTLSSNLYKFFHGYLKNIELEEPEDKEVLHKLTEEAHKLSIIF